MSDKKNHNPKSKAKAASFEELIHISRKVGGEIQIPTASAEYLKNLAETLGGTVSHQPSTAMESTLSFTAEDEDLPEITTDIVDEHEILTPPASAITESEPPTHDENEDISKQSENVEGRTAESSIPLTHVDKTSTTQLDPKIIYIRSTLPREKKDDDESLISSPQVDEKKVSNRGQLQKSRKKAKNKKYKQNKQDERHNDNKERLGQYLTKVSTKKTPALPKTVGSEKKSPRPTTPTIQNNPILTKQSTTRLVSSLSPTIAPLKTESTKPPIDKKIDLIPPAVAKEKNQPTEKKVKINPIFFKVSYGVLLSCLNDLKSYHDKDFDKISFQIYYNARTTLAIEQLGSHRQIALALNDPACREYANSLESVQIMLAGLAIEAYLWLSTHNCCKDTISGLRSGELTRFSETDLSTTIEQIRVNILKEMVAMAKKPPDIPTKEMQAIFAEYAFELNSNRLRAQVWLEEISIELTQAYQEKKPTNLAYLHNLHLPKAELIYIVEEAHEKFDVTLASFKLNPKPMDQNAQELARIAYQLTIALEELKVNYRNLESRKEFAAVFFNEGRVKVKAKPTFPKYTDIRSCELECIAIYKRHQQKLKLNQLNLSQFGLNLLEIEIQPLLLLHEKQMPNSKPWLSQEVQKTTLLALNDALIADNVSESQDKIKKAVSKLEQTSVSMKRRFDMTEVDRLIEPSLRGLKKISELYLLSEKLKHNHRIIQAEEKRFLRLQPQENHLEIAKAQQKLQTIRQGLGSETSRQLDEINHYLRELNSSRHVENRALLDLKDTLYYFLARAFVIMKTQGQRINELLQPNIPNVTGSEKKQLSTAESTVQRLTPAETERETPKLLAGSSRFVGKTTSVKSLEVQKAEISTMVAETTSELLH
ncbi:MAG TPA: hypothetical protein VHE99_03485 [Gammaproteobacteria bacterium]|nr:hypothetical protein [Gammaproteobacteria bacterium]